MTKREDEFWEKALGVNFGGLNCGGDHKWPLQEKFFWHPANLGLKFWTLDVCLYEIFVTS